MNDPYYINFENFSLERLKSILRSDDVLPGRLVLKEDIDARFDILVSMGMQNLDDLIKALSTKQKVEDFSQQSGLAVDYLVILRREVRSYIPKPVYFREIPGVDVDAAEALAVLGITHSKHLFHRGRTVEMRERLTEEAGISMDTLLELAKQSDLARVRGLGPAFTRLFYEAGAESIEILADWDPEELFRVVHALNEVKNITKTVPPLKDFRQYVEMANDLPKIMEF